MPAATTEVTNYLMINGILASNGFEICDIPLAIIHYYKMFKSKSMKVPEELVAVVTRIESDTRLPELYEHAIDVEAAREVIVNSFNSGTFNYEFTISRFTQKVPLIRESAIHTGLG